MTRIRNLLGVWLVLALALGTAACKKEKKAEEGGGAAGAGESAGSKVTEGESGAVPEPGGATGGGSTAAFAYIPGNAEYVGVFSLESARKTQYWAKYQPLMMAAMAKEMGGLEGACVVELISSLRGVTMGGNSSNEKEMVVVVEGLKRDSFKTCGEAVAKEDGKTFTATDEGSLTHYKVDDEEFWGAWAGDDVLVISPENEDKAWLTARAEGKDGLDKNADFGAVAGSANQTAMIWFAAKPGDGTDMAKGLAGMPGGAGLAGIYGSLNFDSGFGIALGARYGAPDQANTGMEMLKGALAGFKGSMGPMAKYIEKVAIAVQGNDMTVSLQLSEADLKELEAMAGPLMQGAMGGGL